MSRPKINTERNVKIIQIFKAGVTRKELSKGFNLKVHTINDILLKNGMKAKPTPQPFSQYEIDFLQNFFPKFGAAYCSKILKRHESSIRVKASKLKLRKYVDTVPEGFKKCRMCKIILNIDNFDETERRTNANNPYGRCRKCKNKERKLYYINKSKDLIWLRKDIIKRMLARTKKRAAKRGFAFNLDYEWIDKNLGKNCPIFGTAFILANGQSSGPSLQAASIDRINNDRGYTKDNCIIISRRANLIKNNASIEELCHIAEFYRKLQNFQLKT